MNPVHKPISTSIQKVTFAITALLMYSLMLSGPLAEWIWNVRSEDYSVIPLWYKVLELFFGCILVSGAIWLNGDKLGKLNIDKPLMVIFIFTEILVFLFYLPIPFNLIIFLITLMMITRLTKNNFKFNGVKANTSRIVLIFMIGLIPVISLYFLKLLFDSRWVARVPTWVDLYYTNLPQVLFEEIGFRGLLWMCLGDLGMSDNKIFYITALLFWLTHIDYWPKPIMFWIWLPLGSLWLGSLVLRTKSLTLSTAGHFLFNLLAILLR